ncbi:IS21 family transposase [Metabacillus litoralis]|uniref:IS21 family transposase n=1 Tax=Metabacillus litoralis TaxID=152268 RepID=UPI001B95C98B|nr:IS21 family transposase [Metabacillus litoralis]UHA61426.1 IS21 family transposase [Metabacillus litoralis]
MTLSRTQESQILDLHLIGTAQRTIAKEVAVCLDSVNKRIQHFKQTGTTHMTYRKRASQYDPKEEMVKQRIRYYLSLEKRKSRFTVNQLHINLLSDGYEVKKSKVGQWVRFERNRLKESYLDIYHEPGLAVQFDWGSKTVKVNQRNKLIHFAVFALPYSNYRYVHVTEKMDAKSFVDAFISFTKHIKCVFSILLIDNMKIAIKNRSFRENQIQLTDLFKQLESHYGMTVRPCTPYRPNQKGTVENAVGTLKQEIQGLNQDYQSIKHLQNEINIILKRINNKKHPNKNNTCQNLMKYEQTLAGQVPSKHFVYFHEITRKVRNNTLVSFDGNYYSAPEEYKGEKVTIRYNDRTVKIISSEGKTLAKYSRCYGKGYKKYRVWNMICLHQQKSDGFEQSNQKRQLPRWLRKLYDQQFNQNAEDYFIFLELIKNVSRNNVKRLLNYHRAYDKQLTPISALDFISRC